MELLRDKKTSTRWFEPVADLLLQFYLSRTLTNVWICSVDAVVEAAAADEKLISIRTIDCMSKESKW